MQAEIISALIGAAVAIPTAGVAYIAGRQATATLAAARTQVEAGRKQWRDDSRRSTWLDFMRFVDDLDGKIGAALREDGTYASVAQDLSEALEKLTLVEFEGPTEVTISRDSSMQS